MMAFGALEGPTDQYNIAYTSIRITSTITTTPGNDATSRQPADGNDTTKLQ